MVVTEDKWLRVSGGRLDAMDRLFLAEASKNGRYKVEVITTKDMIEHLGIADDRKYKKFWREMERQAGRSLSLQELIEFTQRLNEDVEDYSWMIEGKMNLGQAAETRAWRVNYRYTWRAVARAAHKLSWFGSRWVPPANQLMGIALCQAAAVFFRENFRQDPWN